MKRLLLILILTLSFQSLTNADDISDFEIEGISIGDSLLNFVSKEYINNQKPFTYPKSKKFKEYRVDMELLQYDMVTVTVKASDNKYIIYSMMADLSFINNFNKCKAKKLKF